MMRLPPLVITTILLASILPGCSNQDPDQPAIGSISIKARSGAVNERAKATRSARKFPGVKNR
jgi:hypothetical protein